ncbi:MAG: hypothetical protein ACAH80_11365 [Alphaproteobacteria bacterium]
MAASPDQRPLTLVTVFNSREPQKQYGWQKVDDTTVLERKKIPYYATWFDSDIYALQVTVYDFLKFEVTTMIQREDRIKGNDKESPDPQTYVKSFSEVEGKQAIRDAHRALTELKGNPPPLEEIYGLDMVLKKDVSVSSPIRLKSQPPQ